MFSGIDAITLTESPADLVSLLVVMDANFVFTSTIKVILPSIWYDKSGAVENELNKALSVVEI